MPTSEPRQTPYDSMLDNERRHALWRLLLGISLTNLVHLVGDLGTGRTIESWTIVAGLSVLPFVGFLAHTARVQSAVALLLASQWLYTLAISISGHGLLGSTVLQGTVVPLLAALLVGPRAALAFGVLEALQLLVFLWLGTKGLILGVSDAPPTLQSRFVDIAQFSALLTLVAAIFSNMHRRALGNLQRELDQRRAAESAARRAEATQSRFIATMSHEIRTPLHGLLSAARLLRPTVANEGHQMLDIIEGGGESVLAILESILGLQQTDRLATARPVRIEALLNSALASLRLKASEKGLVLRSYIESSVPAEVELAPGHFMQIIAGLGDNAVKFTPSGTIELRMFVENGRLKIVLDDSGPGIPESQRQRVFHAFAMVDDSDSRAAGGAGLGLAVTDLLVRQMSGTITISDSPLGGARIHVGLPLVVPRKRAVEASAEMPRTLDVLVVDDNPVNRLVLTRSLESAGHRVKAVADGEEAVDAARMTDWDVILMDVQMPNVDGLEATRRIRQMSGARSLVPIIGVTASATEEGQAIALDAGMNGYLGKPVRTETLFLTLRKHVFTPMDDEDTPFEPLDNVVSLNSLRR